MKQPVTSSSKTCQNVLVCFEASKHKKVYSWYGNWFQEDLWLEKGSVPCTCVISSGRLHVYLALDLASVMNTAETIALFYDMILLLRYDHTVLADTIILFSDRGKVDQVARYWSSRTASYAELLLQFLQTCVPRSLYFKPSWNSLNRCEFIICPTRSCTQKPSAFSR